MQPKQSTREWKPGNRPSEVNRSYAQLEANARQTACQNSATFLHTLYTPHTPRLEPARLTRRAHPCAAYYEGDVNLYRSFAKIMCDPWTPYTEIHTEIHRLMPARLTTRVMSTSTDAGTCCWAMVLSWGTMVKGTQIDMLQKLLWRPSSNKANLYSASLSNA
eukprot:254546-Pelagomonas_calceolata.AAC.2